MDIWNFTHEQLSLKKRVYLIIVIECKGSSPGRVGFKMAVSETGDINGSVGGGVMEYNMVELARKMLKDNIYKPIIKRQIHDPEAEHDKSGMICSGEQTHAFIPLDNSQAVVIEQIIKSINSGKNGTLCLNKVGLTFIIGNSDNSPLTSIIDAENWGYSEPIGLKDTFYIFGAGHISVPLSQILRMLDFRVVVYDNRTDLSTYNSNQFTNNKQIIDYNNIGDIVTEGENSYVAIMSFGHKFDQIILKQLLPKKLKYLGMIGSKHKVQSIYDNLRELGFTNDDFARVDSPIGLSIKSQTPAEIAISIAAKVIQVRNS